MEPLLFMIAADLVVTTALTSYQVKARERILKKWFEGTLTMPELLWLKRQVWFRKMYMKVKTPIEEGKKEN